MTNVILIVLCYLFIGFIFGFFGGLLEIASDYGLDDALNFLLATCILWPVFVLIIFIKCVKSMPKAVKKYAKFLVQLLDEIFKEDN